MLPLANHLWQSTLFAIAVWLITLTLRKNRAAVRHRLWLAASVKFLVPFSLLAGIGSHFQWETLGNHTPCCLHDCRDNQPTLFGIGSICCSARHNFGAASQPNSRRSHRRVDLRHCSESFLVVHPLAASPPSRAPGGAFEISMDPLRVMYGPARFEPGVFGIFRPVLLLPEGITHRLSPAQLQAVLAHELCHVRRRDNLAMAIHMVVEALFWFHPLVWFIKARLIEEQERACDEEVLRLGGDPQVYAESILKICEFYLTSPLICVSGITGSNLKKRIEDIMRNRVALKLSLSRALLLAVAAIAALAGPIIIGIANVKAGGAQSEPAVRTVASPIGIGEERPLSGQTAQLQESRPGHSSHSTTGKHQRIRQNVKRDSGVPPWGDQSHRCQNPPQRSDPVVAGVGFR